MEEVAAAAGSAGMRYCAPLCGVWVNMSIRCAGVLRACACGRWWGLGCRAGSRALRLFGGRGEGYGKDM